MSINSQILATMEGEGILNEGALPLPDQTFAPSLAVNSGDVIREGQETPLTDSMKQKLLNPTTVFKSLENQVETITTMEEVQKQIATKPAISLADAEQVAMTFEGFTKKISLKEFTSLPTQTGFNTVKQFMTEQIKLRKENISTEAEAYFDGHIADAEQAFEDFSGFYGERLKENLECFLNKVKEFFGRKDGVSNQVFQSGNDFINIATMAIKDIPDLELPGKKDTFEDALENLKGLLENNVHIKNLILTIKDKGSFKDFNDPKKTALSTSFEPSLVDFLQMFADPYLKEFVCKLEEDAKEALNELRDIQKEKNFNPTDFNAMRDFVVEYGEDIDESNAQVHYYIEVIELVQKLHLNASVVLDYFTTDV